MPQDEFDALLEQAPAAGAGFAEKHEKAMPPAQRESEQTAVMVAGPTWQEFEAGWHIYRDPIACGSVAGLVLGVLGVFVVLRRAVFVTATVTQAAGLGVALTFYLAIHFGLELPPVVGAFALSLLSTGLLVLPTGRRFARETVVGITYVMTSALALLVGDRITQEAHDIAAILFGTAVVVRPEDLALVLMVGLLALGATLVMGRGLVFTGFDPEGAKVQGLPVRSLELALWGTVAAMVAASARALGALPVFAFAVLPAAGALAVARSVFSAAVMAALCGAAAGALGYLLAFFGELPVGASQTAAAGILAVGLALIGRLR